MLHKHPVIQSDFYNIVVVIVVYYIPASLLSPNPTALLREDVLSLASCVNCLCRKQCINIDFNVHSQAYPVWNGRPVWFDCCLAELAWASSGALGDPVNLRGSEVMGLQIRAAGLEQQEGQPSSGTHTAHHSTEADLWPQEVKQSPLSQDCLEKRKKKSKRLWKGFK